MSGIPSEHSSFSGSPADARWLVSAPVREELTSAAERGEALAAEGLSLGRNRGMALEAWLEGCRRAWREEFDEFRIALLCEQLELRRRAGLKFSRSGEMWFTRQGLEQSTDEHVARYKSLRFGAAATVADLCCGIGGDLIALAAGPQTEAGLLKRQVVGVEWDESLSVFAQANLDALHGAGAGRVLATDAVPFDLSPFDAWHIDPDRRAAGRRTTHLEAFSPDGAALEAMLSRNPHAAWKLAPSTVVPAAWEAQAEREWIGRDGEVRQQVLWWGRLANAPGRKRVTIVGLSGSVVSTIVEEPSDPKPKASDCAAPKRYVYEPDAVLVAAQLAAPWALRRGAAPLGHGVAYFTSDALLPDPAWSAFEVEAVLPLDEKKLRAALRAAGVGQLEWKKRGVPVDLESLRKKVGPLAGDRDMVLLLAPCEGRNRGILARRVPF